MELTTGGPRTLTVAERVRALRQQKVLTEEALAGANFTKRYVIALERGTVRPSVPVLEAFARRLDVTAAELLAGAAELCTELDIEALQEDIVYQANVAKLLSLTSKVADAMQLIDEIDWYSQPDYTSLPANVAYLVPFLRGGAHRARGV